MSWVTAAVVGGGAILGSMAAGDAADAQLGATREGIAEQRRQFDINQANAKPWLQTGTAANLRLAELLGIATPQIRSPNLVMPTREQFTTQPSPIAQTAQVWDRGGPSQGQSGKWVVQNGRLVPAPQSQPTSGFDQAGYDRAMAEYNAQLAGSQRNPADYGSLMTTWTPNDVVNDPGYQFQQEQGEQAVNRAALARGSYFAPSTVKDLLNFNTGLNRSYNADSFNRDAAQKTQKFNMLSGVSGTGQMTSNQINQAGSNAANNISNLLTQGGNAQASGIVGQANALNNGITQGLNWYNQSRILDWLKPPGQPGGNL